MPSHPQQRMNGERPEDRQRVAHRFSGGEHEFPANSPPLDYRGTSIPISAVCSKIPKSSLACVLSCLLPVIAAAESPSATDPIASRLQASMIWIGSAPPDKQVYAVFRKTLDLPDKPDAARLRLFADSRYILWINGRYVDRGPCRFDPIAPEYDTLDVRPFLRKGKNALAVLVHHYTDGKERGHGDFSGRIMRHAPGLTAQLDVKLPRGATQSLATDDTWRATTKTRFLPSPPSWGSIPDRIDARRDDGDWTLPDFNDAAWELAARIDGSLWGPLRARSIPLLRERNITPLTLIEHSRASADTTATWIWTREDGYAAQKAPRWSAPEGERFFRRTFELPQGATDVLIHATADNELDCFFNGQKVGENHGDMSSWTTMPRMDVTKLASTGRNVIAIRAVNKHYGKASDPAGLLVVVSWRVGSESRHLFSDGSWKASPAAPEGWQRPHFDDAHWPTALPLCPYGQGAWVRNVTNYPTPGISDPTAKPLAEVLPLELPAGHEIVIDAGVMDQAYSVLDFDADDGTELEVLYAPRYLDTGRKPSDVWSQRCLYTARAGRQTYMSGDTFGFKYMVLRVRTGRAKLHDVKIVSRRYPFDCLGAFACNDPVLTKLWPICVRTVAVCSEDAYVDCATRERVEWMGDSYCDHYPVTRVALAGPGDDGRPYLADPRLMRNMLRHIAQSQQPDGRLKAHHPSNRWDIHGYIEDYACLWASSIRLLYDNTGDLSLARELWPALTAQMKWFLDHRTDTGLVNAREFVFFGNPLCYKVCQGAALNAYVSRALRDSSYLARRLGRTDHADRYAADAEAIARAVNTHLWDESAGTYHGAIMDGKKTPPTAHAAVLCLYHEIAPPDRRESVIRWLLANHEKEGFAPYAHYFLLHELYRMNTDQADRLALSLIRGRYEPMTRGETGTVWESFGGGEWCHQAGAVPAYYLSAYVLGVRMEEPIGKRQLLIEPRLGDLEQASGKVVTELGLVPISWTRHAEDGSLRFRFDVPENTQATVRVPRIANEPVLVLDARRLLPSTPISSILSVSDQGRFIEFRLGPGPHVGLIEPRGETDRPAPTTKQRTETNRSTTERNQK
ncbi:MAG: alpha-L-rhamnosidase N-terminal domain-containing protein [Phycisphaerae bacterium]|nr:alpha-L-rhamnosidase N-terminal domain-containing protein [Phycisphaerae bacterium]